MGIYEGVEELNRIGKRAYSSLIMIIGGFALGVAFSTLFNTMWFFIFGVVIGIFGIKLNAGTTKQYKSIYKDLFVKKPLAESFDNLYYDWEQGFAEKVIESFSLCKMGNRFSSEDYIKASYQGIAFEMSDVTVQYHTSGKSSHTTTYFKGRVLVIDFPEKVVTSVQIFSKAFRYRATHANYMKAQKVEMESVDFNRAYDVKAVYPHDAFYLITPAFMERLAMISMRTNSVAIHAYGNKIIIGFNEPTNNSFDATNPFKKISYPDEMDKVKRDIEDIKELITIIRNLTPQDNMDGQNPYLNVNKYVTGESIYRDAPPSPYNNVFM